VPTPEISERLRGAGLRVTTPRACGLAVDVECAVGEAPCLDPADLRGFRLDEAEVTYWGLCPDCQHDHDQGSSA
jgi:Fe2+ or Zn2+ uptake regulation protein